MDADDKRLYRGTLVVFLILLFHLVLIAGIGCVVLLFKGITQYMVWILSIFGLLIGLSVALFYWKMKKERKSLQEMMSSSHFRGKALEVSLLGGFATIKISNQQPAEDQMPALGYNHQVNQLEDPASVRIRELTELAKLLENDMITLEEYQSAKKQLFASAGKLL